MIILIYVSVITALLLFPQVCAEAARNALQVWGLQVLPSLFPYMVFSKMMAMRIKKTRFSPRMLCALLGLIGGSPSGAAIIASSCERMSSQSIRTLCALTGIVSPMFFLGTVRSWTNDPLLTNRLFISQLTGALIAALFVALFPGEPFTIQAASSGSREGSPLAQSIDAILQIGGCIICFSVLAGLFMLLPLASNLSVVLIPVIHAMLEVSGGIHAIVCSPMRFKHIVLAFTAGFGGFSVLSQNMIFLKPIGIPTKLLFLLALLRAALSALVMALLFLI